MVSPDQNRRRAGAWKVNMNRLGSVLLAFAIGCNHPINEPAGPAPAPVAGEVTTPVVATAAGTTALVAATSGAPLLATEEPPITLTAADGTGLTLTRLEAKAVVEGPLAYTELRLAFQNPLDRTLEGRFAITLPDGAALSRFAMKMESGWMEAEVVERQAARRAYEDFLHRRQDPALLENEAGNQFSARVFPIPARGVKELIVSFSHEVGDRYVLPLRGLPRIGHVSADVQVARPDRAGAAYDQVKFGEEEWMPDRDVVVALDAAPRAIRAGDLVAFSIDPLAAAAPAPMTGATILFDTSASRALGYAAQVDALIETVGALARTHGPALPVVVAAFDQQVVEIYRGPASGIAAAKAPLLERTALGASDLAGALAWAASHGNARTIVVGDAVPTVGGDAQLTAALGALAKKSERIDVVLVGGIRDRATAARLTHGATKQDGAIIDGGEGPTEIARRLGLATRSGLAVKVEGAKWTWPETLDGVQPGDRTVVIAQLAPGTAAGAVQVKAGDAAMALTPTAVPAPLLARAAAGAEIARLSAQRSTAATPEARRAIAQQIIGLSTRHRVMSDLTAFLVLETEADYARFQIPRTALVDILVVGNKGLALQHRGDAVLLADPDANADVRAKNDAKPKPKKQPPGGDRAAADVDGEWDADGADDKGTGADLEDAEAGALAAREQRDVAEAEEQRARAASVTQRLEARGARMTESLEGRAATGASAGMAAPEPPPPPSPARTPRPSSPPADAPAEERPRADEARMMRREAPAALARDAIAAEKPAGPTPFTGDMAIVMGHLEAGRPDDALRAARAWRDRDAGDVLALLALGEAAEAKQQLDLAARAYGSIIDLFPSRADLRRFAGERLARVGATGRALAIDSLRAAVDQRPDHLTGHRLLAWELVRAGDHAGAFAALERGIAQPYPSDRFRGGTRILREDLGIVAAAWLAKAPGERAAIQQRLRAAGASLETEATLRFVLYWETDANDVDFHIRDARGNHAYYSQKELASGGSLYEDVTTGYGPECFTIRGKPAAGPYDLQIHYYSRGPMGYGMGLLEIVRHDGKGQLAFEHRPYVVMSDGAYVDLGKVDANTAALGPSAGGAVLAR